MIVQNVEDTKNLGDDSGKIILQLQKEHKRSDLYYSSSKLRMINNIILKTMYRCRLDYRRITQQLYNF